MGVATPVVLVTGGSFILPATTAGTGTTFWGGTAATAFLTPSQIAARQAEIALLSSQVTRYGAPPGLGWGPTQLPPISYGAPVPPNATQLVQQYISRLTRVFLDRFYPW